MKILAMMGCVLLLSQHSLAATSCTNELLQQLEDENMNFNNWNDLYQSYEKFRVCDNGGGVSEGYSEAVVRLLADRWAEISKLATLSKRHKEFQAWTIKHIDATTSDKDLKAVSRHASSECPTNHVELCKKIAFQANNAIKEANQYDKR